MVQVDVKPTNKPIVKSKRSFNIKLGKLSLKVLISPVNGLHSRVGRQMLPANSLKLLCYIANK